MAREKAVRKLNFKPISKKFGSKDIENNHEIILLHEEIEAIYLMDQLGLYQEDAAAKMEVSRPTFSRIIKNARVKVANALISGANLTILDMKDDYIVALGVNSKELLTVTNARDKYILIYKVHNNTKIELLKTIENPIYFNGAKPAMTLPKILLEEHVNYFLATEIGLGLKGALITNGIFPIIRKSAKLEDIKSIKN